MVTEGTLQRSQGPATCPYPEPDQSSPCLPMPLLKINSNFEVHYSPTNAQVIVLKVILKFTLK
jgi:hypothetical protein